jgi:predicted Rossmann fold nucleotide-binding protein DprA/Smf involved in DNA uptake
MKIAIVGSRKFSNLIAVWRYVAMLPPGTVIVSGGARGVDSVGENSAKEAGLPRPQIFEPDWNKYGKGAGYRRNHDIIKAADIVVAFWDAISSGTLHSINLAKQYEKRLIIYVYEDGKIIRLSNKDPRLIPT